MRRLASTAVALSMATAMLTGCAADNAPAPEAPVAAAEQAVKHTGKAFFDALRPTETTLLIPEPESLAAAYSRATVTIEAEVVAVRPGRTLHDLQHIVVELKPTQVLRGQLAPKLNGKVEVEFPVAFVPEPIPPIVEKMKADMPAGPSVWLLWWQGAPRPGAKPGAEKSTSLDPAFYSLVHPNCGVFVEGADGTVVSPAAQHEGEAAPLGARAEGERFGKLKDLVAHARKR